MPLARACFSSAAGTTAAAAAAAPGAGIAADGPRRAAIRNGFFLAVYRNYYCTVAYGYGMVLTVRFVVATRTSYTACRNIFRLRHAKTVGARGARRGLRRRQI